MATYDDDAIAEMAAKGRRPAYNSRGQVRGFRSRPGAQPAAQDVQRSLGVAGDANSPDRESAWNSFFNQTQRGPAPVNPMADLAPVASQPDLSSPDLQSEGYVPGMPAGWKPGMPKTPQDFTSAAIAGNSAWMGRQGVAFPPPPRAPDTSLPAAPFMPGPPGGKLNWSADPMAGRAGTATPEQSRAGLAYNKSLYAPGSASMASLRGTPGPVRPSPWITASKGEAARIASLYDSKKQNPLQRFAGR